MTIDATFWVAVSFFIFVGVIIYLKVPQKIEFSLSESIKKIKNELDNAEKLKDEAKNILSEYETKVSKSKEEAKELIDAAKDLGEDGSDSSDDEDSEKARVLRRRRRAAKEMRDERKKKGIKKYVRLPKKPTFLLRHCLF